MDGFTIIGWLIPTFLFAALALLALMAAFMMFLFEGMKTAVYPLFVSICSSFAVYKLVVNIPFAITLTGN